MAIQTEPIVSQYRVELDRASAAKAKSQVKEFARDTWKLLDQKRKIKLETNVADATIKLQAVRQKIKEVWNDLVKKRELIINTNTAQSNLTEAKRKLQNFRNTWDEATSRLKTKFDWVGKSILSNLVNPVTIATGAIFWLIRAVTWTVRVFQNFEKVQKQVQSIASASWATNDELKSLEETAKRLWASTKFTATEVSWLQLELTKLWFTATEVNNLTASTLDLAAAFNLDLSEAAKNTGAVLKIFWLESSQAWKVNDVLAKAFANSALDLEKFSTAIVDAWPIAKAFWFSLEEVTSLLGVLTDAGFDASKAGTATRNILLSLADWSWDLAKALGWPVETLPELVSWLKTLRDSWIDLAWTLELTDKRSVAAFNRFLEWAESIDILNWKLQDAWWTAESLATQQLDTLDWSLTLMSSAFDWLANTIGERLAPTIRVVADLMTSLVWKQVITTDRTAQLDTQISELSRQRESWSISLEDYAKSVALLQVEKEAIIETTIQEQAVIKELNDKIAWSIEATEFHKQKIIENTKAMQEEETWFWKLTNRNIELQKEIDNSTRIIEENKVGLVALKKELKSVTSATEIFDESNRLMNDWINQLDTARSRKEFDALRASKIEQIRINLLEIQSELQLQKVLRSSWKIWKEEYVWFLKQAKSSVESLAWLRKQALSAAFVPPVWTTPSWGWWWSRSRSSSWSSRTKDLKKEVEDQKKILEKQRSDRFKEILKAREQEKKAYEWAAKTIEKYYDGVNKSISDSEKNIEKLGESIAKTQDKIAWLEQDTSENIAGRVVELNALLKQQDIDAIERAKLQKELAVATENTTQAEIDTAKAISEESETDRIIRLAEEKKAVLETELNDFISQKEQEEVALQKTIELQVQLEKTYTQYFKAELETRKNDAIKSMEEIAAARERLLWLWLWWSANLGNTTNSTTNNWPVNVNVSAQTNATPEVIAWVIADAVSATRSGNNL